MGTEQIAASVALMQAARELLAEGDPQGAEIVLGYTIDSLEGVWLDLEDSGSALAGVTR